MRYLALLAALLSGTAYAQAPNAPPSIPSFTFVAGRDFYTFSGTATDDAPGGAVGLTVFLKGPPGLNGQMTRMRADGTWSIQVTLAPGTQGQVTATVVDWHSATGSASVVLP